MTPPVLIVNPERDTDSVARNSHAATAYESQTDDRRDSSERRQQRMRVGLVGLLTSTDRTHTITVLYSLDTRGETGRLRLIDLSLPFPAWLVAGSRLWLSAYDGLSLRIRISVVELPPEGGHNEDHFAEFVVSQVS